jgi:ABC-type sugar transport system ATPase subunit
MGCQMVALNFQTCDENMLLNKLMFEENGGTTCGYVRKPEFLMMDTSKQENLDYLKEKYQEVNKILQIEIISAQILETHTEAENEQAFPLVELSVHGQASDVQMNRGLTTKIYPNNQFHPIFVDTPINEFTKDLFRNRGILEEKKKKKQPKVVESQRLELNDELIEELKKKQNLNEAEVKYLSEKYRSELEEEANLAEAQEEIYPEKEEKKKVNSSSKYIIQLYYPELAFVVFKVKDARNWYTLKLGGFAAKNVREGIRSIDLYDRQHAHDGFSSILVNIEIL